MAFSFYSSLKSIPRELREAAPDLPLQRWQRFVQLELPFGIIGLVWNSMVSVAGGWFFLMACEMFVLGDRDFRLPGLGSYLQTAASAGDTAASVGHRGHDRGHRAARSAPVAAGDRVVGEIQVRAGGERRDAAVADPAPAAAIAAVPRWRKKPSIRAARERASHRPPRRDARQPRTPVANGARSRSARRRHAARWRWRSMRCFERSTAAGLIARTSWRHPEARGRPSLPRDRRRCCIASLWTIPAGVAIGFNPKLARMAQPLAQIAASVPATALFPIVLLGLMRLGGGLGVGSILLMLLGTQWYILFNVIAGAMAIPTELSEAASRLPLHPLAALADADPAGHLSLPGDRPGDRFGRRLERQHRRRIFPLPGQDHDHVRPRRADQLATDSGNCPAAALDRGDGDWSCASTAWSGARCTAWPIAIRWKRRGVSSQARDLQFRARAWNLWRFACVHVSVELCFPRDRQA